MFFFQPRKIRRYSSCSIKTINERFDMLAFNERKKNAISRIMFLFFMIVFFSLRAQNLFFHCHSSLFSFFFQSVFFCPGCRVALRINKCISFDMEQMILLIWFHWNVFTFSFWRLHDYFFWISIFKERLSYQKYETSN